MNQTKLYFLSLSNDLTRVALAIYNNSPKVVDRFSQESEKWLKKLKAGNHKKYIEEKIASFESQTLSEKNPQKKSEDCLMYAQIFQNYALTLK